MEQKYRIERLRAEDYTPLLSFLNEAFSYAPEQGFDTFLPVMWARDDEHMGKHLVIRDGDKIVAGLGVYPLKVNIMGQKLLFATCGNVGTLEPYRGKGMMTALLQAAMNELDRLGVVAARLEGRRSRYERFGFEPAGTKRTFVCYRSNLTGEPRANIAFTPIAPHDTDALTFAMHLHRAEMQFVDRGEASDFFKVCSAWHHIPYLATDQDGNRLGFLSASADKKDIAELYGVSDAIRAEILKSWIIRNDLGRVTYTSLGHDTAIAAQLSRECAMPTISHASQFKILHWAKLADALLKLKYRAAPPNGRFSIHIHTFGTLVYQDGVFQMTQTAIADLSLDPLTATRFLFGPDSPTAVCSIPAEKRTLALALFPLPLSWNGQDRV